MKFEDVLFVLETGVGIVAAASGNPLLIAAADAGGRLIKIGQDAYNSGRDRGEWTAEQANHFDTVVLPAITAKASWKKLPAA